MMKSLNKIQSAAKNFSSKTKPDKNSEELLAADKQVDRYKDVLDKISKKFIQNPSGSSSSSTASSLTNSIIVVGGIGSITGGISGGSGGGGSSGIGIGSSSNSNSNNIDHAAEQAAIEKRCKKIHEFRLAQAMDESIKELPDGLLRDVLINCSKLEKNITGEIIKSEINIENDVTKKLTTIMDNHLTTIQKQKRIVNKLVQDNESAKNKYQISLRNNENPTKIGQLKEEQEECETKLEKERDIWAAEMFELIAEEENMANSVVNYIKLQQLFYKSALHEIETTMENVVKFIGDGPRKKFKVQLQDHLTQTKRSISYVIELCCCCLMEKGLYEEGLMRVGCATTKLRRFRSAIDANIITLPLPQEYQDLHVIASLLKSYLRDLPDPLLTYRLYDVFISAAQLPNEERRKNAILNAVNQLPEGHYFNLRYLMKFLSILSQKHQFNKMSSQNIAIVMSPNLLWPPANKLLIENSSSDYVQKVNSTAAVNTIVELLVSDWDFFFSGDIDFYITMTREQMFPDGGGGGNVGGGGGGTGTGVAIGSVGGIGHSSQSGVGAINSVMTDSLIDKELQSTLQQQQASVDNMAKLINSINQHSQQQQQQQQRSTHSRSSSHDTSQILLADDLQSIKYSQSNSSLSDSSPPQQNSPKLPVRRKHNKKQLAPTPPDTKIYKKVMVTTPTTVAATTTTTTSTSTSVVATFASATSAPAAGVNDSNSFSTFRPKSLKVTTDDQHHQHQQQPQQHVPPTKSDSSAQTEGVIKTQVIGKHLGSVENLNKPEKPPRPQFPAMTVGHDQCQTLNRSTFKGKPVALPRNIVNVTKSNENLTKHDNDDEHSSMMVSLREKTDQTIIHDQQHNKPDKPAIPERPSSLMRPPSLKGSLQEAFHQQQQLHHNNNNNNNHHHHHHHHNQQQPQQQQPHQQNQSSSTSNDVGHYAGIKKTQSFRSSISPTTVSIGNQHPSNSSGSLTTLERTHIYNVDKKQVAIIDVVDNNNNNSNHHHHHHQPTLNQLSSSTGAINNDMSSAIAIQSDAMTQSQQHNQHPQNIQSSVPPSPRGFDPKIKRPQIPAPPPPTTNRPKSDGSNAGDSTNL